MGVETKLTMPLVYFYRGKNSDRALIEDLMNCIPDQRKHEVAKEYERIYLSAFPRNRKAANDYLEDMATLYSDSAHP